MNRQFAGGTPMVSVVIPTHRRSHHLRLLLESLREQTLPTDRFEVIVIDDASADSTGDVLVESATRVPNLRFEQFAQNMGPARARNRGVELAAGELILFLDDDVAATPQLLETHVRFHDSVEDGRWALLGRVDWHPSLEITPFMRWLDASGLQFAYDTWLERGEVKEPYRAFYMANISIPRPLFIEAGGFDERFRYPAFEDYELGWRLAQRGLRLAYWPEAQAYHTRAIDLRTFRRRTAMVAKSAQLLLALHPEFGLAQTLLSWRLTPVQLAKHLAYAPIALLRHDERRLGALYREVLSFSYERGKRRGQRQLAAISNSASRQEEAPRGSSS